METRIGEWYLCEGYIEEPVVVEALESDRVQVRYLTTGRTRWLGYPRIWRACKPQALPYDVEFDPRTQMVVLYSKSDGEETEHLTLGALRSRYFPHVAKPRLVKSKKAPRVAATYDNRAAWEDDLPWKGEADDSESDSNDDEEDFALDMSM
ncbi:MAG TPA: hypothetical protein VFY81_10970 [Gammaproteobacteria bacterium]|nr:hypothetical protein [Gammaproteobacteria bacterium]